jgi:hypothetical protein
MFKPKIVISIIALVTALIVEPSLMEAEDNYIYRPISISIVPGFSTNGPQSDRVITNFSLNIIGGVNAKLYGFEAGSVFNIEKEEVIGFQSAGVFNLVGGYGAGFQTAGVGNIVGMNFNGLQTAGVINAVGGDLHAFQVAGAANLAMGTIKGAQIAGAINIAGSCNGAQVAGAINIANEFNGAQISGAVNIASECKGAQIGVVNIAKRIRGVQIGIVNISDEMNGIPIGLVSIVKNGQFHVNVWADETALLNFGIKTGSKSIYNLFTFGLQPVESPLRWMYGLGIGGHIALAPFFFDIDAIGYNVFEGLRWWKDNKMNLLNKLRFTAGWQINPRLAVTAGPSVNVFVSNEQDGSKIPLYDLPIYETRSGNTRVRIWSGFSIGLQLL